MKPFSFRFIHRTIEDEEHYRQYGVFLMPAERQAPPPPPPQATNMNQPPDFDHHIAPPSHPPPPPPPQHYYSTRENILTNQPQTSQPAPTYTQNNSTIPLVSRRRSFGMADIEALMPSKRPHLEDIRSSTVSTPTYNTQNPDTTHQCRFIESNIGQTLNQPQTVPPNSVAQVQPPPVASVVIAEDVINIYRLYEEHNLLRRRVEINEERLQELRATNTYLLQQNEQLRRQTQCSCTNTIVNPVTLTTASQQSATPVNILQKFIRSAYHCYWKIFGNDSLFFVLLLFVKIRF